MKKKQSKPIKQAQTLNPYHISPKATVQHTTTVKVTHTTLKRSFLLYLKETNQTEEQFLQRTNDAMAAILTEMLFGKVKVEAHTTRGRTRGPNKPKQKKAGSTDD